jgi:hypothetical protein
MGPQMPHGPQNGPDRDDVARQLGAAEAAFDLLHVLTLDSIVTDRLNPVDAFDSTSDAIRIAGALVEGPRVATLVELERRLEEDQ